MNTRLAVGVPVATLWAGPDSPRDVDAPAVAATPDVAAWTAGMGAETRLGLHGRTLSQLLLAEPVDVLEERAGWASVVAPWQPSSADQRGYPGWLPLAHLGEPAETAECTAVVTQAVTRLDADCGPPMDVSWGTVLPVLESDGDQLRVALPGGGSGRLPSQAVVVRQRGTPAAFDPERLLSGARQFRGLRYLWGGTCGFGLDCSGLVHLAFRVAGVVVPRDAHDQHAAAEAVALGSARPGDLYFFRHPDREIHHVGFVTGPERMLHATEGTDVVEDAPLDADRRRTLCAAGRFPVTRPKLRRPFRPGVATEPRSASS